MTVAMRRHRLGVLPTEQDFASRLLQRAGMRPRGPISASIVRSAKLAGLGRPMGKTREEVE
jgi:hypothetical protein